jgi:hypothetical protein
MFAPNATRWIGIGLLALPFYRALIFWPSIDPQPDPSTYLEAWSRFVTTNHYALATCWAASSAWYSQSSARFALGAYLTRSRTERLGLVAMVMTVLGSALFLPLQGFLPSPHPRRAGGPGRHRGV